MFGDGELNTPKTSKTSTYGKAMSDGKSFFIPNRRVAYPSKLCPSSVYAPSFDGKKKAEYGAMMRAFGDEKFCGVDTKKKQEDFSEF